jgi:hypothetical protein
MQPLFCIMPIFRSFILAVLPVLCLAASGIAGDEKLSATDYISIWKQEAIYQMAVHRVPASITLAQGMLESGNGNSRLAREGNNHFGIKCHSDWSGKTIREDDETRAECFRKYPSARESFDDHSVFLKRKRYAPLFELKTDDYKGWARGLKECGYATNPQYPQLLIRLIETHRLYEYDAIGMQYMKSGRIPERNGFENPVLSGPDRTADRRENRRNKGRGTDPDQPQEITLGQGRSILLSTNRIRYVIAREGDSPESIARELEMGRWQILRYNDLGKEDIIQPGEVIYLQPKRARGIQDSCTVKAGDTLKSISQEFGIKVKKLASRNGLETDAKPVPGTVLRLR